MWVFQKCVILKLFFLKFTSTSMPLFDQCYLLYNLHYWPRHLNDTTDNRDRFYIHFLSGEIEKLYLYVGKIIFMWTYMLTIWMLMVLCSLGKSRYHRSSRNGWWPQKPPPRGVQSHILKFKYPSLKFCFTENNVKRPFVLALLVWETKLHVAKAILELTGVQKDGLEFLVFLLCLPEL